MTESVMLETGVRVVVDSGTFTQTFTTTPPPPRVRTFGGRKGIRPVKN